ncbi:MAG: sulfate transporter [Rhodopirellula sp. TMED11]|nr:MAG: sulfate transporter [Rhodopirellula sp. TMED11]
MASESASTPQQTNPGNLKPFAPSTLFADVRGGLVVFLVALPLCLGIALASDPEGDQINLPLMSGLIAGIVGGLVVGPLSGSQTSVSGPAAGLTAVVLHWLTQCGSVETFLLAVFLGGVLQVGLGFARAGSLSAFFPSSVIKGLLAAIGVILILKQLPHVFGHDQNPEGQYDWYQPDHETTLSELFKVINDYHIGAAIVGILSVILLIAWDRIPQLKKLVIPGPLVVVILGVVLQYWFQSFHEAINIGAEHLVNIPIDEESTQGPVRDFFNLLIFPDWMQIGNPIVWQAAVTIAIVASLESLLNLEAVDKLDPHRRQSPANRELFAQGIGNMVSGAFGGLPVTSVIVRGSVNVGIGAKTKASAIFHGGLLLIFVMIFPKLLNTIPLSCLAAILLVTGFKLASPKLVKQMWSEGRYQFIPFIVTVVAIVRTDLLTGILIGLAISTLFILNSNLRSPIRRVLETHLDGEITHVELAQQVSFLNRGSLNQLFDETQSGTHILIDASASDYIDPDILSMIREFKDKDAPARGVKVSLRGFRSKYDMKDELLFADYATKELKERSTPDQVLALLKEGNQRFVNGKRVSRDLGRQVNATSMGQNPLSAVLSCIDSRVPVELILDQGIGDVFSIRVAGNIIGTKSMASLEYAVAVSGVKLVLVLGHTRCGAVISSIDLVAQEADVAAVTGCQHLGAIVDKVAEVVNPQECRDAKDKSEQMQSDFVDEIVVRNVQHTVEQIPKISSAIAKAIDEGKTQVVGAVYDVSSGKIYFLDDTPDPTKELSAKVV